MIFRRVKAHIEKENWFAVFIDFLIVVVGVFIGLQFSNWNESRQERDAYQEAKGRLLSETTNNLASLEQLEIELSRYLNAGIEAFDVLLACKDSPENQLIVNRGLSAISGTYGISLQSNALDEITSSETLLSRQSIEEREQFARTKFYFDLVIREANFAELLPLAERIQNNEIIGIGEVEQGDNTYVGVDFSRRTRRLELKVPLNEACKNDQLIKSFFTWERWQVAVPALSRIIKVELEKTQIMLDQ